MKTSTLLAFVLLISFSAFSQTQITIASLRTIANPSTTTPYFVTDANRQGMFYYDAADLNSKDNNGTIIVNGSKRYKRLYSGSLDVRWFGMKGDFNGTTGTDNSAAFNAAIAAAKNNETLMIPEGQFYIKSVISMPLVTTKKVIFEIFGNIFFARGGGFIVEGHDQIFKSYGIIDGGNTGASNESTFAAYVGTGVYLKNAYNCLVEVNEIKNFKYGIHQSGDKSGGNPEGSQYNKIYFNAIHHNYVQIRISTIGATSQAGNWNNESFWYGGQLGRGIPSITYGAGGTYGVVFHKETSSNATQPMTGHMFHDIGFEGLETCILADNACHNTFFGGGMEPEGSHTGISLDPATCVANRFIGLTHIEEHQLASGRLGQGTVISATPIWTGVKPNIVPAGSYATESSTPGKLMITTGKYSYTNFVVNKTFDLRSEIGEYPTIQAMTYRIKGQIRSVPYKSTFLHVTASTAGSPITLPTNIGLVRVEANQAKVFKIDTGDIVQYGEGFMVEYLSPQYPISFVRSDNGAVLIPATAFPSGGTYRCLWANGQYKISRIGTEFKSFTQTGGAYVIGEGVETHYVNYPYGNATATLPPASTWPGRTITVKNMQAAKTVQVIGVSASDETLMQGRGAMTVRSDGTSWNIISFYKRNITY